MPHIEEVTITLKGLSGGPQIYKLPRRLGEEIEAYIEARAEDFEEETILADKVFPDVFDPVKGPAVALRGLRHREELTQKELADRLDIHQHHLSEMENGKRPIGKAMAKKLAKVLRADWKIFL